VPLAEHDVLGLQVTVQDPGAMGVFEPTRHLPHQTDRLLDRQRSLPLEPCPQRLALDEWHDEVQLPVRFTRIEHRHDVRVSEVRGRGDLTEEAFLADRRRMLSVKHLHRDAALVLEVLGEVHGCHAAPAELALDTVAVSQRAAQLLYTILGDHANSLRRSCSPDAEHRSVRDAGDPHTG
jgi:hypothetical protein